MLQADIIICGGGPAGCSAAIHLSKDPCSVILIDKHLFPRDKICGDALSGNSTYELSKFPDNLFKQFAMWEPAMPTAGIRFVSPGGYTLDLDSLKPRPGLSASGFVAKRYDFDAFLWNAAQEAPNLKYIQGNIQHLEKSKNGWIVHLSTGQSILGKIILGADGAQSRVAKFCFQQKNSLKHQSAGLRCYMQGIEGFTTNNLIELHFIPKLLPGYFWLFPLPNQSANIGLGIRSDVIAKKKLNLKTLFQEIIDSNLIPGKRFENAIALENVKGAKLPLGSTWRKISDEGVLLLGDAAGLIDPFSGEGIGNALASGRIAAEAVREALRQQSFSAAFFNQAYTKKLKQMLQQELRVSYALQQLLAFPKLFDHIAKKASENESLRIKINHMLHQPSARKALLNPTFWWKMM
jgi:geranylgeranyl reductase family protein